jgi:hypothetical protein
MVPFYGIYPSPTFADGIRLFSVVEINSKARSHLIEM